MIPAPVCSTGLNPSPAATGRSTERIGRRRGVSGTDPDVFLATAVIDRLLLESAPLQVKASPARHAQEAKEALTLWLSQWHEDPVQRRESSAQGEAEPAGCASA